MIKVKCIYTLFFLTIGLTRVLGQTNDNKKISYPFEIGMSGNYYDKEQKATLSSELFLLITKNTPLLTPPESKFFGIIGYEFSSDFTIKLSTGFIYYHNRLETQLKINACPFEDYPTYYIEPKVGIGFLNHDVIILIGYNMLVFQENNEADFSGLTVTLKYRGKWSKQWYE